MDSQKTTLRMAFLSVYKSSLKHFDSPSILQSTQGTISSKAVLFTELAIIAAAIITLIIIKLNNKRKTCIVWTNNGKSKAREVAVASYCSFTVPRFVDGFLTLYKLRKDGLKFFDEAAAKYGTFFEVPIGTEIAIFIADPVIAQSVLLSTAPEHLNKPRHIYDFLFIDAFMNGLVSSEYQTWKTQRKILNRSFTYKSLQSYLPFMNTHAKSLVNKFLAMSITDIDDSVHGKEMYDLIWSEAIKIIFQTVIGNDWIGEKSIRVHRNFHIAKTAVQERFLRPELMIEPIWKLHPMKWRLDKAVDELHSIANEAIGQHKVNIEKEKVIAADHDINSNKSAKMGNLENKRSIEAEDDDKDMGKKQEFRCLIEQMLHCGATDEEIFNEMATFVSTGHETTSLAINQTMFHLALHPEYQAQCREEIDYILGPFTSERQEATDLENLTMDDLNNLKFLDRCIHESLRLTTTTPVFLRRLDDDLQVSEDMRFKGGSTLVFCPWVVHRDPNNYPDPFKFDPDRFLPENTRKRHPYSFMPFSGGARNCIGYKYAIMEIKVVLAWMMRYFEIHTTDTEDDIKYFLELTLVPHRDINVILKRRKVQQC